MITKGKTGASHGYRQSGFSMVEMLMAAFILAIGILGLTMLQTLALHSNAGSKSMTSAIQVAEKVMDQAEALGRNSLLWARSGQTPPTTINPNYFGTATITSYAKFNGASSSTPDYFTVTITPTVVDAEYAGIGGLKLITVEVRWHESLDASGVPINRSVVISRRISYATLAAS